MSLLFTSLTKLQLYSKYFIPVKLDFQKLKLKLLLQVYHVYHIVIDIYSILQLPFILFMLYLMFTDIYLLQL